MADTIMNPVEGRNGLWYIENYTRPWLAWAGEGWTTHDWGTATCKQKPLLFATRDAARTYLVSRATKSEHG